MRAALALLLSVALALPALAEAPETALRPMARPAPEAPGRPMLRPAMLVQPAATPTDAAVMAMVPVPPVPEAEVPVLEARVSTRGIAGPALRELRIETLLERLGGGQVRPAVMPAPVAPLWSGPRPMLRAAVAPVAPAVERLRPALRPASMAMDVAARQVAVAYAAWQPSVFTLTDAAVARSLRPEARPRAVSQRIGDAPAVNARPLQSGNGICGVAILTGSEIGPVPGPGACGIDSAVEITAVGGIRLTTPARVDCTTATALARWVSDVAAPAVGNTGGGIARLEIAGSYVCRNRNHRANARLSEHSFGRAIDIAGLRLQDGTRLTVARDWSNPIMRAIHRGACGIFQTTLGPGSDGMHEDHFHFDTARRGSRYCR